MTGWVLRILPIGLVMAAVGLAALASDGRPSLVVAATTARAGEMPAPQSQRAATFQDVTTGPALGTPAQSTTSQSAEAEPKEMPPADAVPLAGNSDGRSAAREATRHDDVPTQGVSAQNGGSPNALQRVPPMMGSPLASAEPEERSEQMERIARQADRQCRHGLELAGRKAYFAARAEFFAALRLVAEGLDAEQKTTAHARALAAGQLALKEAEDFLPGSATLEATSDVAAVVAGHSTPVLKGDATGATPMTALRSYFTFAQEQFAAAAGREVAGSMALRALGKLHEALAGNKTSTEPAAQSKAMVFYQAALLVYPANYMAANDLGVLLARAGNTAEARTILEYSASLSPQAATWHSLAVVYRQTNQPMLADWAGQRAVAMGKFELARQKSRLETARRRVQWMDPQQFAETSTTLPSGPAIAPAPLMQGRPGERAPISPTLQPTDGAAMAARDPRAAGQSAASDQPMRRPSTAERMRWGLSPCQR